MLNKNHPPSRRVFLFGLAQARLDVDHVCDECVVAFFERLAKPTMPSSEDGSARGSWLVANSEIGAMAEKPEHLISLVPVERIELPTFGLQNRCSTAELTRQTPLPSYARRRSSAIAT